METCKEVDSTTVMVESMLQPSGEVTNTVYCPPVLMVTTDVSETCIGTLLFQVITDPGKLVASRVVLEPTQKLREPANEMVGAGLTITSRLATSVHPLDSVTVTV